MKSSVTKIKKLGNNQCDIAVTKAILEFYGKPYSERSLLDYLHHHAYGSLLTEIADCLYSHGVQPTIVSSNPEIFSSQDWNEFSLRQLHPHKIIEFHINEMQRVIKKGVLLQTVIPSQELIESELKKKHPVIISCNRNILVPMAEATFHYAIISEADEKSFTVVDSLAAQPIQKYPKSVVMLAIQSLATKNPMAGSIVLTRKISTATNTKKNHAHET